MNKSRLKNISDIIGSMNEIEDKLECILNDENDSYDNMLEGLQCSEQGERSENAINNLEEAIESLRSSREYLIEID